MCKRLTRILIMALLLVLPATVYAKPAAQMTAALEDFQYSTLGVTTVRRTKDGLVLQTTGLEVRATIACNGDSGCVAAMLDGRQVMMWQVARLDIDHTSAGIVARSGVELALLDQQGNPVGPPIRFKGKGDGTVQCAGGICHSSIELATKAQNRGKLFLRLDIDHSSAGVISSIEGQGLLVVGN